MEIQVGAILLQMINFGIVVGVLYFLLLKPVKKILDERSKKIEEGLKASESAVKKQEQLDQKIKEAEKKAQEKAKKILDEAKKDANKRGDEIIADAKRVAQEIRLKNELEIQTERKTMAEEMTAQFESTVIAVAKAVVGKSLSLKDHQQLIKQGLSEIQKAK